MKFGIISDIHFHRWKDFNQGLSRLHLVGETILEACLIAKQEGAEAMLFCGDLFHSKKTLDVITLDYTYKIMAKASEIIPWIAIKGNHDQPDKLAEYSSLNLLNSDRFKLLDIEKPLGVATIKDIKIYGLGWVDSPKTYYHYLSLLLKKNDKTLKKSILITHTQPIGSVTPAGYEFHDGINLNELPFKHIFVGHIHKHQRMGKVTIPGSPYQQDLGDVGDNRGFLIYDYSADKVIFKELSHPKFIITNTEPEEGKDFYIVESAEKKKSDQFNIKYHTIPKQIIKDRISISLKSNKLDILNSYIDNDETDLDKHKLKSLGTRLIEATDDSIS